MQDANGSIDRGGPVESVDPEAAARVRRTALEFLEKGVEAKIDIDPETLTPGYVPQVIGVGKLFCGYYPSEQAAIEGGTAWLRAKAQS